MQLEALESLSAECNSCVQTLLNTMPRLNLEDVKPQLVAIKEAFLLKDIDSDDGTPFSCSCGLTTLETKSLQGDQINVFKMLIEWVLKY